jgi:long-chain acyl-CoA synthetase
MSEHLHVPYRSIPDMLLQRVAATPDRRGLGYPTESGPAWMTWQQVGERVTRIAAGLHSLGVRSGDRVAIAANTRVEWVLADLGTLCTGAATTTVYPTTEPNDAAFILSDSGSKALFAENPGQVAKIASADLPALTHVIVIDAGEIAVPVSVPVISLADLEELGAAVLAEDPELVTRLATAVRPDQLATLMYTSGTTGTPKGVELLHGGWCWQAVVQANVGLLREDDLQYIWLPLSHSFGKTLTCGIIHAAVPTYIDGRVDKLVDNLAVVKPSILCGPPRIYEKVYNRIVATTKEAGGAKWKIFSWAFAVGREAAALRAVGKEPTGMLRIKDNLADRLVFSKIRERLGGHIRALVSGSAPLSKEIAEFFFAARVTILEGYGLTETSAGAFLNRPDHYRVGTVGTPLGDMEVRIAEDGEVELRGVPVMRGYHNLPVESAACFTPDGFFKTGDIGQLDSERFLTITDRKKDLIKTSGGKYVAPSHIEGMFKAICPYVSQVLVIGQARNFCTMVVTLDPDSIGSWAAGGPLEGKAYAEIVASAPAEQMVADYVKELNAKLNRWEAIKKFVILPRDLTVEAGELTPSMKIKRKIVETTFSDEIEKMYAGTVAEI